VLHANETAQIIETDTASFRRKRRGLVRRKEGALIGLLTFRMRGGTAGHRFRVPCIWIRDRLPEREQWAEIARGKAPAR